MLKKTDDLVQDGVPKGRRKKLDIFKLFVNSFSKLSYLVLFYHLIKEKIRPIFFTNAFSPASRVNSLPPLPHTVSLTAKYPGVF